MEDCRSFYFLSFLICIHAHTLNTHTHANAPEHLGHDAAQHVKLQVRPVLNQ
jgi:hypothetical protein